MTDVEPVETTNTSRYGTPPLDWSRTRELLATHTPGAERAFFLGTSGPDGRPHAAGIGAQWLDGHLYFVSGPGTRKSRDLAANPAATMSVRLPGMDLVFEGEARRVVDRETLDRVAAGYRAGGWPAEVEGDALTAPYSAPSAGPAPWHVYRFLFEMAHGVASEAPGGSTRWRFER